MLLFGAKKLPMLARGLGTGIRNFKGELKESPKLQEATADPEAGEADTP